MIYNIREYTREDTSAMRSLWSDAFGDSSELIDFFFRTAALDGNRLCCRA